MKKLNHLLVVGVVAGLLAWSVIVYSQQRQNLTAYRLCVVLAAIIKNSGQRLGQKGAPGYFYYQTHPSELAAARHEIFGELHQLPCQIPIR